ncbi:MAG: nucleoside-diphosphate kinase [Candidatus Komeilibacteria bacterium]|nr:nucleoside-diphosphate kinase [Candidatus Komeilibacteria bacterium]
MIHKEKTLVIIKPDGVQRTLIGEIIRRYERVGLKLIGLKMIVPTLEQAKAHYLVNPDFPKNVGNKTKKAYEAEGKEFPFPSVEEFGLGILHKNAQYFSSGPVVVMAWQGLGAVGLVRKITGGTEPINSDVGTIRGDFTLDSYAMADTSERSIRNLVHASGSIEEADKELALWFTKEELLNYRLIADEILYDVNLDGILE